MKISKALLVFPLLCMLSQSAYADCAGNTDEGAKDYTIAQATPVEHTRDKSPTGCLAKINDGTTQTLVYTPYEFICKLPPDEKISLSLQKSCCDAGSDGDYPCGISPKKTMVGKLFSTYIQTSITAAPARLDKRAIPDLVGRLESGSIYGIKGVSEKLILYIEQPAFAAEMRDVKERLKKSYAASTDPTQKENLAAALMAMPPDESGAPPDVDLLISSIENSTGQLDGRQLYNIEMLGNYPDAADKSIPALLALAQRYASSDPVPMMKTLVKLGPAVGPYLGLAYRKLDIDKLTQAQDPDKTMKEFEAAEAQDSGKEPLSPEDTARKRTMLDAKRKELTDMTTRARMALPLWRQIACASRDNMGDAKLTDDERAAIMRLTCETPNEKR